MVNVSHTEAVTTIRKAKGLVHLVVSRPPDQMPNTYLSYLPPKSNGIHGNNGTSCTCGSFFINLKKSMFGDVNVFLYRLRCEWGQWGEGETPDSIGEKQE